MKTESIRVATSQTRGNARVSGKKYGAAILLAGPFMNVLGTIGIITFLFQFGVNSSTIHVIKLMPDSPAQVAGIQADDVFISINKQRILRTEDGQRIIQENKGKSLSIEVATDARNIKNSK